MNHAQKDLGFTLIELLIVIAIIGILASVSIPQYNSYRAKAFDVRAQSDLRNVAIAEEAYFIDYEAYHSCSNQTCADMPGMGTISKGVLLAISATPTGFTGTANHPKGSGETFKWNSEKGGMIE